ncbi:MAG: peptidylprolyl isomerase [Gammaproteobacteria bacterium]|nr:peptidylprolyl isomerase [Gammaproteobacteria bacterium]
MANQAKVTQYLLLQTSYGDITIGLYEEDSPLTCANFLRYVDSGRYQGTVFHRVSGHVIQGGGFDKQYQAIETFPTIKNEATNGLKNLNGTLAMARFTDKDSADSQFYINLDDNAHLDHRNDTNLGFGYAVFGVVVDGFDVIAEIQKVPVGSIEYIGDEVPAYPVILQQVKKLGTSVTKP